MSDDHDHGEHEEDIHKEESDVPDVITNSDLHKTMEEDEEILHEVYVTHPPFFMSTGSKNNAQCWNNKEISQ